MDILKSLRLNLVPFESDPIYVFMFMRVIASVARQSHDVILRRLEIAALRSQ